MMERFINLEKGRWSIVHGTDGIPIGVRNEDFINGDAVLTLNPEYGKMEHHDLYGLLYFIVERLNGTPEDLLTDDNLERTLVPSVYKTTNGMFFDRYENRIYYTDYVLFDETEQFMGVASTLEEAEDKMYKYCQSLNGNYD